MSKEQRDIYMNCKKAKCWASVNIKELMAEKAELKAEFDKQTKAIKRAIQNLEHEESRLNDF
ncbi:MAG: hypothetical protein IIC86_07255, partial [Chloroflexi bacterium]|nr:hypothetical protein [Chloroflexota bacterium]